MIVRSMLAGCSQQSLLFSPPQDFVVAVGDRVAQLILERFGFQESALFS